MTDDILEQMKGALIRFDGLFLSRDGAADAMPFLGADALYLFPEAIKEIEELRASIKGKTFTVLSDDGEAWKARAIAAEAKANVMVADKINLRSELLSVEAKLAKAVEVIQDAYFEGYNSAQKIHDPFSPAYAWEKSKARAEAAEIGGEKP